MQQVRSLLFTTLVTGCALLLSATAGTVRAEPSQHPEATVTAFFEALSVAVKDGKPPKVLVTSDFTVFEVGKVFDRDAFYGLITSAGSTFKSMTWSLSDFTVTRSDKLAHVRYRNDGLFVDGSGNTTVSYWLESALLVADDGVWKLKFLQSDLVTRERRLADGSVQALYPNVTD